MYNVGSDLDSTVDHLVKVETFCKEAFIWYLALGRKREWGGGGKGGS